MSLAILIPLIMVVAIASVLGIMWVYKHTAGTGQSRNPIEETTRHVEENTRNLANGRL